MAVASYQDVATALGRPIDSADEIAQVEHWLTGVELVISQRLGDVSLLDPDAVIFVEAEAVAAKVRHSGTPESSITVSVDDGAVTRRYEDSDYAELISDAWWDLLGGHKPRAVSMGVSGGWMLK